MGNDPLPRPPTVEYATPARETRRSSRTIMLVLLVVVVLMAGLLGLVSFLFLQRSAVTLRVAPATVAPAVAVKPPTLALPSDPLRLTMRQRESRALPGSNDTVFITLSDITRGQVLLDVTGPNRTRIANTASLRQGDSAAFPINGQTYVIDVLELHNTLTSDDFAILSIATPGKRPTATTAPSK